MTLIGLVRHGSTDWNLARLIQGQTDIPLNLQGIEEATALAKRLQKTNWCLIYSSDLIRAQATARIIADTLRLSIQFDPTLRERNFGCLEGSNYDTAREILDDPIRSAEITGIETITAVQERILTTLNQIAAKHLNQKILIVTHGGVIRQFLKYLEPKEPLFIGNASLTKISLDKEQWQIVVD